MLFLSKMLLHRARSHCHLFFLHYPYQKFSCASSVASSSSSMFESFAFLPVLCTIYGLHGILIISARYMLNGSKEIVFLHLPFVFIAAQESYSFSNTFIQPYSGCFQRFRMCHAWYVWRVRCICMFVTSDVTDAFATPSTYSVIHTLSASAVCVISVQSVIYADLLPHSSCLSYLQYLLRLSHLLRVYIFMSTLLLSFVFACLCPRFEALSLLPDPELRCTTCDGVCAVTVLRTIYLKWEVHVICNIPEDKSFRAFFTDRIENVVWYARHIYSNLT